MTNIKSKEELVVKELQNIANDYAVNKYVYNCIYKDKVVFEIILKDGYFNVKVDYCKKAGLSRVDISKNGYLQCCNKCVEIKGIRTYIEQVIGSCKIERI